LQHCIIYDTYQELASHVLRALEKLLVQQIIATGLWQFLKNKHLVVSE
jgi:hypothetical protein